MEDPLGGFAQPHWSRDAAARVAAAKPSTALCNFRDLMGVCGLLLGHRVSSETEAKRLRDSLERPWTPDRVDALLAAMGQPAGQAAVETLHIPILDTPHAVRWVSKSPAGRVLCGAAAIARRQKRSLPPSYVRALFARTAPRWLDAYDRTLSNELVTADTLRTVVRNVQVVTSATLGLLRGSARTVVCGIDASPWLRACAVHHHAGTMLRQDGHSVAYWDATGVDKDAVAKWLHSRDEDALVLLVCDGSSIEQPLHTRAAAWHESMVMRRRLLLIIAEAYDEEGRAMS